MKTDRNYYKFVAGGFAAEQFEKHRESHRAAMDEWEKFIEKYGADQWFSNTQLLGLVFEDSQAPKGWRTSKKYPSTVYYPARKKECMEAYIEHKALPLLPDTSGFTKLLGIDCVLTENRMHFAGFEQIGEEILINLHVDSEVPDGLEKLKMSEYFAMKEALEVAA